MRHAGDDEDDEEEDEDDDDDDDDEDTFMASSASASAASAVAAAFPLFSPPLSARIRYVRSSRALIRGSAAKNTASRSPNMAVAKAAALACVRGANVRRQSRNKGQK
jgi:hypothetical protein